MYEKDGSDNSSNKILLSSIGLNDRNLGSPKTFDSCGKSIHDNISSVVEESDYIIKMNYSDYRENDSMNFIYNPSNKSTSPTELLLIFVISTVPKEPTKILTTIMIIRCNFLIVID